jgi:putative ABC transport system permease protein
LVTVENIKVAIASIKDNLLRSLLTLLIIAVGIACLVGILTAIDSLLYTLSDNFNRLGANSFTIFPSNNNLGGREDGRQTKRAEPITYRQAMEFTERYSYGGARVAVDLFCRSNASIVYGTEKTNPTVRLIGIDENYFFVTAFELAAGRNFSKTEVESGAQKIIIGDDIVQNLFNGDPAKAIGKYISIGNGKFRVIGALEQKGSSSGQSNDRRVFIPLMNAKKLYGTQRTRYNITVSVINPNEVDDAVSYAVGAMRNVRDLKAGDENDFEIRKSDSILNRLKEMTSNLRLATIVIAMLTLLGASIGLMNIMLVSVTERTKEIGVRKALGATRANVLTQFLTEAIVICILGGLVGIVFGIIIGVIVTKVASANFVIPWNWMTLGIIVCVIVGVVSGLYPALKASRLDPIEALRYE